MNRHIAAVTFLVRDYDEAISYFTDRLGFTLVEDAPLEDGKRWVVVAPTVSPGAAGGTLLLAKAANADQMARVGNQVGGRVFLFLYTDDFRRDHIAMKARGITFLEEPRDEPYGRVAVFCDLYGNKWDLLEPKSR